MDNLWIAVILEMLFQEEFRAGFARNRRSFFDYWEWRRKVYNPSPSKLDQILFTI